MITLHSDSFRVVLDEKTGAFRRIHCNARRSGVNYAFLPSKETGPHFPATELLGTVQIRYRPTGGREWLLANTARGNTPPSVASTSNTTRGRFSFGALQQITLVKIMKSHALRFGELVLLPHCWGSRPLT